MTNAASAVVLEPRHDTVLDSLVTVVLDSGILLAVTAILTVVTVIYAALRIRKIAKSEKPDEAMSTLGMLIGLGWSSEAVWILTGPDGADLILPLRILMFAIMELILGVFMIRAKRNMKDNGNPGKAGVYTRVVACGMSLVATTTAHNFGEGVFRLLIPLLLVLMWWDGLVGETKLNGDDEASSFNWTPRKILTRIGAISPGAKDVKTVHREHLTQRMTVLYHASLYGPEKKRDKIRAKLAKLTLDADDDMIQAVTAKVRRTGWVNSQPLPYAPTQPPLDGLAQQIADLAQQVAHLQPEVAQLDPHGFAQHDAHVALPPTRRAKPAQKAVTGGYAPGEDPATQAAQHAIAHGVPIREAARLFGANEGTVRNRRKAIEASTAQDSAQPEGAQPKTNGHPVMAHADQ